MLFQESDAEILLGNVLLDTAVVIGQKLRVPVDAGAIHVVFGKKVRDVCADEVHVMGECSLIVAEIPERQGLGGASGTGPPQEKRFIQDTDGPGGIQKRQDDIQIFEKLVFTESKVTPHISGIELAAYAESELAANLHSDCVIR